jgi:hypothetical protein
MIVWQENRTETDHATAGRFPLSESVIQISFATHSHMLNFQIKYSSLFSSKASGKRKLESTCLFADNRREIIAERI